MAGFRDPLHKRPKRMGWLRTCFPCVATFTLLSILLSSLGLLAHFRSPARAQQLGWQSWDVVRTGSGDELESGSLSLPLDVWDPLLPHTTGLTEIAIGSCYLPPLLFPSFCRPSSTSSDDKLKGKWVMVVKDLNIRTGVWYLNLYYRRTHRLDAPVITDLRIAPFPLPSDRQSELSGWVIADGDLRSGVWPQQNELRLYYKLSDDAGLRRSGEKRRDDGDVITELDVVFGDDAPFYGFERVSGGPVVKGKDDKWETVDVAYRRGSYEAPQAPIPVFHEDGTFKIMQIADLHYSVGKGECRSTDLDYCDGDAETAKWLAQALDEEKPDMVVFSGDQLNGQKTSYDARSVLAKFAAPVIDRQIPWAAIFGNHDSEIEQDRDHQMKIMMQMPYSLAKSGPKDVDGTGNYLIRLYSADNSKMHLFSLYFLDSGDYQGRTLPWEEHKYDYIKQSQIDWYHNVSSHISPISRPFHPDGGSDLGKIWDRSISSSIANSASRSRSRRTTLSSSTHPDHSEKRADESILAKPNAIMFFHIPLQEAYDDPDVDDEGNLLDVGMTKDIGTGASETNSHMLDKGILSEEAGIVQGEEGFGPEVRVLSHGHCHLTERCRRVKGVWMCFDGGSSYSGYGMPDFPRRVRVYQLSEYGEKVETYKRLVSGDVIDRQVLVQPIQP